MKSERPEPLHDGSVVCELRYPEVSIVGTIFPGYTLIRAESDYQQEGTVTRSSTDFIMGKYAVVYNDFHEIGFVIPVAPSSSRTDWNEMKNWSDADWERYGKLDFSVDAFIENVKLVRPELYHCFIQDCIDAGLDGMYVVDLFLSRVGELIENDKTHDPDSAVKNWATRKNLTDPYLVRWYKDETNPDVNAYRIAWVETAIDNGVGRCVVMGDIRDGAIAGKPIDVVARVYGTEPTDLYQYGDYPGISPKEYRSMLDLFNGSPHKLKPFSFHQVKDVHI